MTPVTTMLPFLMFGIGLDDAFIIYGSYNRTDPSIDTMRRIQITIDDVGLSISLTTITSTCAFITGVFSNIPAVRDVCLYAAPTIVIDFIYQITFFIALIVLDEQRIKANRKDICFWSYGKVEEKASQTTELDPTEFSSSTITARSSMDLLSPVSTATAESSEKDFEDTEQQQPVQELVTTKKRKSDYSKSGFKRKPQHFADRFMKWFAKQLLRKHVQTVVIIVFLILNAVSIISATYLRQEFNYLGLVPEQSYLQNYYAALNDYTNRNGLYTYVFFRK